MATVPAPAGTATSAPAHEQTNTPPDGYDRDLGAGDPGDPGGDHAVTRQLADTGPKSNSGAPRGTRSLQPLDSGAMFSELSDAEKECIGDSPERQTRFFGCLEDETLARISLAGFVPGPAPLSQETSDCVRAAFEVIDPRAVMTAGIEGDPSSAMAGSMAAFSVTIACLTDQEWEATAPVLGMSPDERAVGCSASWPNWEDRPRWPRR